MFLAKLTEVKNGIANTLIDARLFKTLTAAKKYLECHELNQKKLYDNNYQYCGYIYKIGALSNNNLIWNISW